MIRPESMTFAEFVCSEKGGMLLMEELYACGDAEIEKSSALTDSGITAASFPLNETDRAKNLLSLAEKALTALGAAPPEPSADRILLPLDTAESKLASAAEIFSTEAELKDTEQQTALAEERNSLKEWIRSLGIQPENCLSSHRCRVFCGTIPSASIPKIEKSSLLTTSGSSGKGTVFLLAVENPSLQKTGEILAKEGFRAIDPAAPSSDPAVLREKAGQLKLRLDLLKEKTGEIAEAYAALKKYLLLADQIRKCGLTGHCIHISAWIPSRKADAVTARAVSAMNGEGEAVSIPAETAVREKVFRWEEIPSLLSPSRLLDPFRMLFSIYAVPAYRHIDPSLPGGLFFLLFFGMMFADAGHGLALLVTGILLRIFMLRESFRTAGVLMIFCGLSSAFFGFLFGSFFGREDIIHPLLFHPAEQVGTFLLLGVAIGFIVLSTGIILNIIQKFWQREKAEAVFSQWGVLSLGFYWLCAGIIGGSFFSNIALHIPTVIAVTAIPLLALIAGEIILQKIQGSGEAAETAFLPVEIVLGLLSNSVSFVRIAAFGLCHIALMSAVYVIAASGPDDDIYRLTVSIEGNIFVICLEALIVTIQCLRLQFYEFFSKFFSAQGRPFAPLRKI